MISDAVAEGKSEDRKTLELAEDIGNSYRKCHAGTMQTTNTTKKFLAGY